jgi:hypothetical protein
MDIPFGKECHPRGLLESTAVLRHLAADAANETTMM